jgi:VWFA-related protein
VARSVGCITTALTVLLLTGPGSRGNLNGKSQQIPSFRSGIDVVRVDVSVLDKDRRPIRGLTAADFVITIDGTPQPIVGFDAVVMPPREVPTAPWMRDVAPDVKTNALSEPRLFVIIMDDAQTPLDSYMVNNARTIARGIVDNLSSSDLAAVVFTKDNRAAQDFTSDRARLLAAVDSFRSGWLPEMGLLMRRYAQETVRQAVSFLRNRPHGRNAIMLLSVGGGIVEEEDITARSDGAGITGGSGENPDPLARDAREAAYEAVTGLSALAQDAALARIPIYGFSLTGLMADVPESVTRPPPGHGMPRFTERSGRGGNDVLRILAAASGGRAIVDDNEPARMVPAVFEENGGYYVIGYRATYNPADGRTHRLKIRVNRPGAFVYPSDRVLLAAKPARRKTIAEPPPPLVRAIAEMVPKSDLRLAVTAAPFAFPPTRDPKSATTGVLAALRVTRPAPDERVTEQVQVLAKVFTPEGKEVGAMRQNAAVRLRPAGADAEFDVLTPLGLKPGRYNVRFSAHSIGLDRTGSVYTDVIVPDFEKAKLSLSGVVITADPTLAAAPKDAFTGVIPVLPTTRREFDRGDRVTAFVRIHEGGRQAIAPVGVTVEVTDAHGAVVTSRTDAIAAGAFSSRRSTDYTYDLPVARLAAGTYLMTIEARLGDITSRRDVRFSVR